MTDHPFSMLKTYKTPRNIQQVNEAQAYGLRPINHMAFTPRGFMFHSHEDQNDHLPSTSSLRSLPSCPPQLFPSGGEGGHFEMKRSMSFSGLEKCEEVEMNRDDDFSDDGSQLGEKKKRLKLEQVQALEKSFELGNKLEPKRKMQLAKALGLQPRQIAIWFQNRRAKWKTKELEKDYEALKRQFDALKADNDALQTQNKKLVAELLALKGRESSETNLKKEAKGSWSNGSENSCDVNLDISRTPVEASPASCQRSTQHFLTTSIRPNSMTHQLPQGSSRSDLQCLKVDHQLAQDENFCNIFNGIYEQQGFWPWPEQHAHHFH